MVMSCVYENNGKVFIMEGWGEGYLIEDIDRGKQREGESHMLSDKIYHFSEICEVELTGMIRLVAIDRLLFKHAGASFYGGIWKSSQHLCACNTYNVLLSKQICAKWFRFL